MSAKGHQRKCSEGSNDFRSAALSRHDRARFGGSVKAIGDIDLASIASNLLDDRGERLYVLTDVRVECSARLDFGRDALGPDLSLDLGFGGGRGERCRQAVQYILGGLGRRQEPVPRGI